MFALAVLLMFGMGAWADEVQVVYGPDGVQNGTTVFEGGSIVASQLPDDTGKVTVTLTVTPSADYTISKSDITVVSTYAAGSRGETSTPAIAGSLALTGKDPDDLSQSRDYTLTVDPNLGVWVRAANFQKATTPGKGPRRGPRNSSYLGYYYISSNANNAYYLCPATVVYQSGMPFLTTYQTNKDANSLWLVMKSGDYYAFVHVKTGQYLTLNEEVSSNATAQRLHLESLPVGNDIGDNMLFEMTVNGTDIYNIKPKSYTDESSESKHYLNSGNSNKYTEGIIGFGAANNNNSKWKLNEAPQKTCLPPIVEYDATAKQFTITSVEDDVTIYYTTDGSDPATGSTNGGAIPSTGVTVIRAIATKDGYTNSAEVELFNPSQPVLIKNKEGGNVSFYMLPPLDATTTNVTTSNVPHERMAWLLEDAGLENGIRYYYFKNQATGEYLYCVATKTNGQGNALEMRGTLGAEGTNAEQYRFQLLRTDDAYTIVPQSFRSNNIATEGVCLYKQNNHTDNIKTAKDDSGNSNNGYTRWTVEACPSTPKSLSVFPLATTSSGTHFLKIQSYVETNYYVYPPAGTSNTASSGTSGSNPEWYLKEATDSDPWVTYYYIVNAETGQYLYFRGIIGDTNSGCFFTDATDNAELGDAYKFIVVRTCNSDERYNIIPKQQRNQAGQTYMCMNRESGKTPLRTQGGRTNNAEGNKNSQWKFVEQTGYLAPPIITFDTEAKTATLTCADGNATIYYTTDGSTPDGSIPTTSTYTYSSIPVPLADNAATTIKAYAVNGGNRSTVSTASVTIGNSYTAGYYALHLNGTGYLRVQSSDAALNNDGGFKVGNVFSNDGSSIWIITAEGYLQNDYYYLNVANNRTLYLDVLPRTRWMMENVEGGTKKHLYINDGTQNLYLCNDGGIGLKASTEKYYSACPITIEEQDATDKWTGPSTDALTLLTPQRVTFLRHYFTQKITYTFTNDGGTTVGPTNATRRIYATLHYKTGGDGKGSKWDITNDDVIYNKTNGNVDVTATYEVQPADPIARGLHPTTVETGIKFTLQPKAFTPDASTNYLMTYINDGNNRFPFDDGLAEGQPVRVNGTKSRLTEAVNPVISWKITVDEAGFCSFQNLSSGRWLYFDNTDYANSDFGVVKMGATTLPTDDTRYKFRLYKPADHATYGPCFSIIPYEKQFVIYAYNGRTNSIRGALFADGTNKVLSVHVPETNKWKFYPYEVEDIYRFKDDYTIAIPDVIKTTATIATATAEGTYNFSVTGYHWKSIKDAPVNNTDLEIAGSKRNDVTFSWEMTGLDGYASPATFENIPTDSKSTFAVTVEGMPKAYTMGKIKVTTTVSEPEPYSASYEIEFNLSPTDVAPPSESDFVDITTLSQITNPNGAYRLIADTDDRPSVTTFTGYLDGNFHTVSNLSAPLFQTVSGDAMVRNLNLSEINISGSGYIGAVTAEATGRARIYNIGILSGQVSSSDGYCGGLVGKLDGMARVINCFSYATVTGGTTVGGIVGYNNYPTTQANLRTMVMNCMMYGDITGGSDVYPVYGGEKITNKDNNKGVNNYNFYRDEAKITVADLDHYFCSWPVEEEYLTRFDYVRSALNANRELCAWWITGDVSDTALVAKWVYAPQEKPHPILKRWGRYPSMINRDIDGKYPPMINRDIERKSLYPREGANDYEGKQLGTLTVKVQDGNGKSIDDLLLPITDMDINNYDYGYYKVQLPYFNDVFGNPTATEHTVRYGGNYTKKVVVGWEVVSVVEKEGLQRNSFIDDEEKESRYNFADRNCTEKDLFSKSGRVFAQGGYYYVPEGVTGISIRAHWAWAYYCANTDYARDRIDFNGGNNTSYVFTPAGTIDNTFHGEPVYAGLVAAQNAITTTGGVYDNAIVLVGNVQHRNGTSNGLYTSGKTKGFTIMSVDLDFDDEPDYVLPLQTGQKSDKAYLNPIRFDFVQAPDLGMVLKRDMDKNRLAVSCIYMTGHFEITETSALHFNELYFGNNDKDKLLAPVIFNGGQTLEFVAGEKGNTQDRTQYIIAGGNAHMRSLYQGNHNKQTYKIKHAPMSVMGGEFDECYLSGNIRSMASTAVWQNDSPHLYTNGGRFTIIAGAGQEAVNGSVYFQIDHSIIDEFYGGSTSETGQVTGDINVQIDHSRVGKYCGGPMVGNMAAGKTITTRATGTTFGQFFGAGNGGTSYTKIEKLSEDLWSGDGLCLQATDNDWKLSANYSPMRWDSKGNKSYEARYHFEIWTLPSGTAAVCAARRYVYGAQFAATETGSVTSTLTNCIFEGDFYGGGNLGAVKGDVTSTLTDCEVKGSVYGAGYSATIPSFECYPLPPESFPRQDPNTSICHDYKVGKTESYTWTNEGSYDNDKQIIEKDGIKYVHTDSPLDNLGSVSGDVTLTLDGTTKVTGSVYGGGDESALSGNATVTLQGDTEVTGSVFGGGNEGDISGNTSVNIKE